MALFVLGLAILLAREHAKEPRSVNGFPPEDIEAARLKVLPYRQSGLIFSWADEDPSVFVTRAMWEALPEDAQRDLGQAIAVAKDVKMVRIRDGQSESVIATCTAAGRCRQALIGSSTPVEGVNSGAGLPAAERD